MPERPYSRLILVGTVHLDPHGFEKLVRLLEDVRPYWVTVEISPFGYRFRMEKKEKIKGELLDIYREWLARRGVGQEGLPEVLRNALDLLDIPFELSAPLHYFEKKRRKGRVHMVDVSRYSREKLRRLEREMLERENIFRILNMEEERVSREEETVRQMNLAASYFRNPLHFHLHYRMEELREMEMRDRWMAGKIEKILQEEQGRRRRLVHAGGWEHLVDSPHYNSLYRRLKGFDPCRLLLG